MSAKDEKSVTSAAPEIIDAIKSMLDSFAAADRQRRDAENRRRAALTMEQRKAEDQSRALRVTEVARKKLANKIAKFGDELRTHDTWTIERFCWLLAAEDPDDSGAWGFMDTRSGNAEDQHKRYKSAMDSCIHTRLKPVNPSEPQKKWRFTTASLLEVAKTKRLGCFDVLAEMMPEEAAKQRSSPQSTLPAQGTQSRERQRIRRRMDLLEIARAIAIEGQGTISPTRIALAMHGVDLNRRFREKYPQWAEITDKTLEADRTACKPRIEVLTGRPRRHPENSR